MADFQCDKFIDFVNPGKMIMFMNSQLKTSDFMLLSPQSVILLSIEGMNIRIFTCSLKHHQ